MQNSFLIYADYEKKFELLDDVGKGKLIMAIFAFNRGEDLSNTLDSAGQMALSFIKDQMLRDSEAYEMTKKSRSEAGKRGMEARWGKKDNNVITKDNKDNNVINVIPNNNTTITSDNKNNLNDNVNVNVNEDVDVKGKEKKKKPVPLTDDEINFYVKEHIKNPTIQSRFLDFVKNRKMLGSKYAIKTETTLELLIKDLKKFAKGTVENAIEILNYSIANNYQGIFNIFDKKSRSLSVVNKQSNEIVSSEEAKVWNES